MLEAVHELGARLRSAGRGAIGFFYYTGHGVAVGGENVLIPANAADKSDRTLNVRGVKLGDILDILKREPPATEVRPPSTPTFEQQAELQFWATVKDSKDPATLQLYLDQYPNGTFAALAKALIEERAGVCLALVRASASHLCGRLPCTCAGVCLALVKSSPAPPRKFRFRRKPLYSLAILEKFEPPLSCRALEADGRPRTRPAIHRVICFCAITKRLLLSRDSKTGPLHA
jgi:hypothetical protein